MNAAAANQEPDGRTVGRLVQGQDGFPNGRTAVTRNEFADMKGYKAAGIRRLYDQRAETGFPEAAFPVGTTKYWWLDELDAWWLLEHPPVERTGDPDDKLFAQDIADLLGYDSARSVTVAAKAGRFPAPDGHTTGEGEKGGQPRPWWYRRTYWEAADGRKFVKKGKKANAE